MEKKFNRTLVTSALPYANGGVHIGHLAGVYVPADIYVRYLRLKKQEVLFIGGSDEHGVPVTIRARKEGITTQEVVDRYHNLIKKSFEDFGISFDIYSRTTSKIHNKFASDFFRTLYDNNKLVEKTEEQFCDEVTGEFLTDRNIVGTCPRCGKEYNDTIPALGHDWGEWQSNGNDTHSRICTRNSGHKETVNCSGGTATCQAKAVCAVCRHEYGQLGTHSFTAETVEEQYLKSAATCTEKAVYYRSCATCGLSAKDTAEEAVFETRALGHDWGKWQSNGDGTHTHVCTRDDTHKETVSCSGGTATCVEQATCKDCGGKYGEKDAANHTGAKKWTTTKTTHEQKWSCCGEITVAKEAHTFGKWVVTEKATSRKDGEKTRTCEVCDYVETAKIPATGTSPKTGDDSHIGMWAGILCVSLAGIIVLVVLYKKKHKK